MIWINGVLAPAPSSLEIGVHRISRSERTSSGRMSMEIIAIKRAISLVYNIISGTELGAVLTALEATPFHTLRYPDPQGAERTTTVYVGDIKESAWHTVGGERFWTGVSINFIEQ